MTPPTSVIIAFAALLGYPLVQIVAIRLRRRRRLEFNALIDQMRADPAHEDSEDQALLDAMMQRSRGSALNYLVPAITPLAAIAMAVVPFESKQSQRPTRVDDEMVLVAYQIPQSSSLRGDGRLRRALLLESDLSFANYPLTMMSAGFLAIPFAIVGFIVGWITHQAVEIFDYRRFTMRLTRILYAFTS